MKEKIRSIIEETAIPVLSGIAGSFIGMGLAKLLGIL